MAQSCYRRSSPIACLLKSTQGTRPSCTNEILRFEEQACSVRVSAKITEPGSSRYARK